MQSTPNVAMFSTQAYDKTSFAAHPLHANIKLSHFDIPLNAKTVSLCQGFDTVCAFVNDQLDEAILT